MKSLIAVAAVSALLAITAAVPVQAKCQFTPCVDRSIDAAATR
jgi:hypothetical protein